MEGCFTAFREREGELVFNNHCDDYVLRRDELTSLKGR